LPKSKRIRVRRQIEGQEASGIVTGQRAEMMALWAGNSWLCTENTTSLNDSLRTKVLKSATNSSNGNSVSMDFPEKGALSLWTWRRGETNRVTFCVPNSTRSSLHRKKRKETKKKRKEKGKVVIQMAAEEPVQVCH